MILIVLVLGRIAKVTHFFRSVMVESYTSLNMQKNEYTACLSLLLTVLKVSRHIPKWIVKLSSSCLCSSKRQEPASRASICWLVCTLISSLGKKKSTFTKSALLCKSVYHKCITIMYWGKISGHYLIALLLGFFRSWWSLITHSWYSCFWMPVTCFSSVAHLLSNSWAWSTRIRLQFSPSKMQTCHLNVSYDALILVSLAYLWLIPAL